MPGTIEPIVLPMKNDHHSDGKLEDHILGVMYKNYIPTLVSLGRPGYESYLSINEVIHEDDGYHITRRSMYTLTKDQLADLKTAGELDLGPGKFIRVL